MKAPARIALSFVLGAPLLVSAQGTTPLVVTTYVDRTDRPTFTINKSAFVAVFEVTRYAVRAIFPQAVDSCGQRMDPGIREIPAQVGRRVAPAAVAPWVRIRCASNPPAADPAPAYAYLVIAATSPLNCVSPADAERKIRLAFADVASDQFFTTGRISAPFSHFAAEEEIATARPLASSAWPADRADSLPRLRRAI